MSRQWTLSNRPSCSRVSSAWPSWSASAVWQNCISTDISTATLPLLYCRLYQMYCTAHWPGPLTVNGLYDIMIIQPDSCHAPWAWWARPIKVGDNACWWMCRSCESDRLESFYSQKDCDWSGMQDIPPMTSVTSSGTVRFMHMQRIRTHWISNSYLN